ncbi:MAG TPA: hypothetical protein VFA27_11900 [Vicinamibacterales bacterium]|nr:hypothetical protein [Vicinamibacterales bacterium]
MFVVGMLCIGAAARADEIVLPSGPYDAGSGEPFACASHIQQVFDASLFPGSMKIDALTFSNTLLADSVYVEPAHYQFSLSTTPASSTSLSTNYSANLGADTQQVIVAEEPAARHYDDAPRSGR